MTDIFEDNEISENIWILPISANSIEEEQDEEEVETYKIIIFNDKNYIKFQTDICYDYYKYVNFDEQVVVGKWNNITNIIDFYI